MLRYLRLTKKTCLSEASKSPSEHRIYSVSVLVIYWAIIIFTEIVIVSWLLDFHWLIDWLPFFAAWLVGWLTDWLMIDRPSSKKRVFEGWSLGYPKMCMRNEFICGQHDWLARRQKMTRKLHPNIFWNSAMMWSVHLQRVAKTNSGHTWCKDSHDTKTNKIPTSSEISHEFTRAHL